MIKNLLAMSVLTLGLAAPQLSHACDCGKEGAEKCESKNCKEKCDCSEKDCKDGKCDHKNKKKTQ